jgi:hyperosmotically inducible protein
MHSTARNIVLVASITLGLAGLGSAFAAEPKSADTKIEQIADVRREAQIMTTYGMNRHLRDFNLSVTVDGNKAVLDGTVQDGVAKDLAEQIAMGVDGIRHVDNRIVIDANYVLPQRVSSERSFGEKVEDATITATIKSKLLWNSNTDGLDIHIDTNNGKVTLSGSVSSDAEKSLAGRIAKESDGVVGVKNELALVNKSDTVMKPLPAAANPQPTMSDAWVTAKVKSSLMLTRGVDSLDIKVTTRDGVVSLQGVVDSTAERELAIRVAQDIRGVKKVDASSLKTS